MGCLPTTYSPGGEIYRRVSFSSLCKDWLARHALPLYRFVQKPVGERHGRESLDFPGDCFML